MGSGSRIGESKSSVKRFRPIGSALSTVGMVGTLHKNQRDAAGILIDRVIRGSSTYRVFLVAIYHNHSNWLLIGNGWYNCSIVLLDTGLETEV